jgi:hypothetical protein
MTAMIISKSGGHMNSFWLTDTDGYAVEFKGLEQIEAHVDIMKKEDPTITGFVAEWLTR